MALCDSCKWYDKENDDFRGNYDDRMKENDKRENHYCIMYDDSIPKEIWYENGDCPYYRRKE